MKLMQNRIVVAHLDAIMSNIMSNLISNFISNLFEFLLFKMVTVYYINPVNSRANYKSFKRKFICGAN